MWETRMQMKPALGKYGAKKTNNKTEGTFENLRGRALLFEDKLLITRRNRVKHRGMNTTRIICKAEIGTPEHAIIQVREHEVMVKKGGIIGVQLRLSLPSRQDNWTRRWTEEIALKSTHSTVEPPTDTLMLEGCYP